MREKSDGIRARGRRASGADWLVRLAIAATVQMTHVTPAGAQDRAQPQFQEELKKQESIYRSQGEQVPGGYIVTRGLAKYVGLLPSGFEGALKELGSGDRWLDIGAGSGQAILDYYATQDELRNEDLARRRKAGAVAISIEDRRTALWAERLAAIGGNRIQYLVGKRLRNYSLEELGKFQLITDVYGGFSYTDELSVFTQKVLDLLEVGGSFYSLLQSVRLLDGKDDPNTWYLTEIVDANDRDVKVCSWLGRIACVQVTCDSRSDWHTPTELIHIRKTCDAVSVPPLERLIYEAGNPPGRRFRFKP